MKDDESIGDIYRDYEPIPEHLLRLWTVRLKEGETGNEAHGLAQHILHDFCLAVWTGNNPPKATLGWLADILAEILDDGRPDARKAFSLLPKQKRGKSKAIKHIEMAQWVYVASEFRGYTKLEAIKLAAAIFFCDEKTIRRAWNQCNQGKGWNFNDNEVTAEIFRQSNRPLPEPKTRGTTKK